MPTSDTYVRARIDSDTKQRANDALEAIGLYMSDAIRMLIVRIAEERCLPFEVRAPHPDTRRAIRELDGGDGKTANTLDDLMTTLHEDD